MIMTTNQKPIKSITQTSVKQKNPNISSNEIKPDKNKTQYE